MIPYSLISSHAELVRLCETLNSQRELAVDLEMDSLHHYQEKVCLIQISTRSDHWLIDPLTIGDLTPLAAPLGNPDIMIVMHGADYDVRSLHRDYGIEITNLFDTMIAARFLGVTEFGLAALLKAYFSVELDKKFQKADWSIRPLSDQMCDYAAADTAYLLGLYDLLQQKLEGVKRSDWQSEECHLVTRVRIAEKNGPLFLYCKGAGKLKGRSLAALENLLQMRDRKARELDRPVFKVMPTELLLELASHMPAGVDDLAAIKGMTPKLAERYGKRFIAALDEARQMPEQHLPGFPRQKKQEQSEATKDLIRALKTWREHESSALGIDPGVLAPNWLLESVAESASCDTGFEQVSGLRQWQINAFGDQMRQIVSGRAEC